ncbi:MULTISPECIES: BMP family protein [unclassified Crossiella]|uniref:BMP family lipoprotein n=1 Tax=unclassified Crossiella TaxID=2620835 RepID=UPI001FFE5E9B|nr:MULTISPECIES: BMP family ABC transporter substrate-binding protein [unclassified Crossiella]MCK2238300.1 BMP family ABC transporter substrate-binding protein [Crossiella sp. S99.2]MCK2256340.1 BMP family ABC transporter substrate-binding protein [Crossiella sp. S99.1]
MRNAAVAAVAITSVLSLVACAKDSGTTPGGNAGGAECQKATPPTVQAGSTSSSTTGTKPDAKALKVGLTYDIGGRGDASFNDAAAAGIDRAIAELGVQKSNVKEASAAAGDTEDVKSSRLRQLASEGYNPIVAVGFAYADALKVVAAQFPNTRFAIVDAGVEGAKNVTPLVFAEEQGSFLAGVIAAYKSKKCSVGFVGGVNVPLIQKFEAGFYAGAKAAAPNIKIEKKYLTPAGDVSGFNDPTKGKVASDGLIDGGADVLYHAAGASGKGVFNAAKARGALAIGVDSDQYKQTTVAESKDIIISSVLKRVDVAVYDYIAAAAKNDLSTLPKSFDLSVDGVGYATSGGKIDDIKSTVDAYKAAIVAGQIKVSDKPSS